MGEYSHHESEIAAEMRKLNEAQQANYRIDWYQRAFFMVFEDWLRSDDSPWTAVSGHQSGLIDGVLLACHATAIKVVRNMKPEIEDD